MKKRIQELESVLMQIVNESKGEGKPLSSTVRSAELLLSASEHMEVRMEMFDFIGRDHPELKFEVTCHAELLMNHLMRNGLTFDQKIQRISQTQDVAQSQVYVELQDIGVATAYTFSHDQSVILVWGDKMIAVKSIVDVTNNFQSVYIEYLLRATESPYYAKSEL